MKLNSPAYFSSGPTVEGRMRQRNWRGAIFASCLCVVMLGPFLILPSPSPSLFELWPVLHNADAEADEFDSSHRTQLEGPSIPAETQRQFEESAQDVRKRFQQVHLSIHNYAHSYIDSIEKGRLEHKGSSPHIGITWVDHLTDVDTSEISQVVRGSNACVKYGLSPENYSFMVSASTHTYAHGGWKGQIHDALLPDLLPSTRYYYRVGDTQENEWSEQFDFFSPPLPSHMLDAPSHDKIEASVDFDFNDSSHSRKEASTLATLAFVGDVGISLQAHNVLTAIRDDSALDAVVHIGDFAYSIQRGDGVKWTVDNDAYGSDKQKAWDQFFRMAEPIAAYKPYMAVPGNHEGYKFDYHFIPFAHRFFMPGESSGFWYWFDYSSIHFVALSSDHNYSRGSEQYKWLEAHLSEFSRARNSWMHKPRLSKAKTRHEGHQRERAMYSSAVEQGSVISLRHELEPLFNRHGVDIVMHGHDHSYERTHPVVGGQPQFLERSQGIYVKSCVEQMPPIYLRAGTGGIKLEALWNPPPAWSAVTYNQAFGYMRLTTYSNNTLRVEYVTAPEGQIIDALHIMKDPLVPCSHNPLGYSSSELASSPMLLLLGVALALIVACQARFCKRQRRRVFDMQVFRENFFNPNSTGGYITRALN